jgi:hypothetical protein
MTHPQISTMLYDKAPVLVTALIAAGRMRDQAAIDEATLAIHQQYPELVRHPGDVSKLHELNADCARRYGSKA